MSSSGERGANVTGDWQFGDAAGLRLFYTGNVTAGAVAALSDIPSNHATGHSILVLGRNAISLKAGGKQDV